MADATVVNFPLLGGYISAANGSIAAPSISFANYPTTGWSTVSGILYGSVLGSQRVEFNTTDMAVPNDLVIVINKLSHSGIHILEMKGRNDATLPCLFRIANTWTDASNNEWGAIDWQTTTNVLSIGASKNGSGTLRDTQLIGANIVLGAGTSNLATTATAGFPQIPACSGTPTGAVTSYGGHVAAIYDDTAHKIWFRSGATWRGVLVA